MRNIIALVLCTLAIILALIPCHAQDTLKVGVLSTKTDTTLEVRIQVRILSGWKVQNNPEIEICCCKSCDNPVIKPSITFSEDQQPGYYLRKVLFLISIPLRDLKEKKSLSGSITLIAVKEEQMMEPDKRSFTIDLKKILGQ